MGTLDQGTPPEDGSVTEVSLADDAVTDAKIATQVSTKITGLPTQTQDLDMGNKDIDNVEGLTTSAASPEILTTLVNNTSLNDPEDIAISGKWAFVVSSAGNSLTCIDIETPASPKIVSTFVDNVNLIGANSIFLSNNHAFITTKNPNPLVTVAAGGTGYTGGDDITLVGGTGTAWIFNVDTVSSGVVLTASLVSAGGYTVKPSNPVSTTGGTGTGCTLTVSFDGITIIDVTTPKEPALLGSLSNADTMRGASGAYVTSMNLYVSADISDALSIIDITDPTTPVQVGSLVDSSNLDGASSVNVVFPYAYLTGSGQFTIINITDKTNPTFKGKVATTDFEDSRDSFISGNNAYVSGFATKIVIVVDITNPADPTETGSLVDSTNLNGVEKLFVVGDYIYAVSSTGNSFTIIDTIVPAAPLLTSSLIKPTELNGATSLALDGTFVYITAKGNNSLTVVSISGVNAHVAKIGHADIDHLAVTNDLVVANTTYTGALNVGTAGIHSKGDMATTGDLEVKKEVTVGDKVITPDVGAPTAAGLTLKDIAYLESNAANVSQSGIIRLGNSELATWRNANNSADLSVFFNSNNNFQISNGNLDATGQFNFKVDNSLKLVIDSTGARFFDDITTTSSLHNMAVLLTGKFFFDSLTGNTFITESSTDSLVTTVGGIQALQSQEIGTEVNTVFGKLSALATSATNGFIHIPTMAGTPTGTPTAYTGKTPIVYDTTNDVAYIYNSSWKILSDFTNTVTLNGTQTVTGEKTFTANTIFKTATDSLT